MVTINKVTWKTIMIVNYVSFLGGEGFILPFERVNLL